MSDFAISVENLGKMYRIRHQRAEKYSTLRDEMARQARSVARRLFKGGDKSGAASAETENFWALSEVSFQVKPGEVVGIIGRNGAGKSTLLKILSRITEPTTGRVRIQGRVASLLEVGTGFHPELTGRENVFLNGAILGMSWVEIKRKFDEIVAFAGVEKFLDTPVKRYSSGMHVRLAFAVAAHLDPEILIVDEVLAVGDAEFQKKCLGKMEEVSTGGRTVLFVSHNMATIQRLCRQGVLLEGGRLIESGSIQKIVERYTSADQSEGASRFDTRSRTGTGWARIVDLRLVDAQNQAIASLPADDDLVFEVDLAVMAAQPPAVNLRGLVLELIFYNEQGHPLFSVMNVDDGGAELPAARNCRIRVRLPGPTFIPGKYRVKIFLGIPFLQHVDEIPDAIAFEVLLPSHPWRPYDIQSSVGSVVRRGQWECQTESSPVIPGPAKV